MLACPRNTLVVATAMLVTTVMLITAGLSPARADLPANLTVSVVNHSGLRCPSEARVLRKLEREMAAVPMYFPRARFVVLTIDRGRQGLTTDIRMTASNGALVGSRQLRGRSLSCVEMMDTAILTLSVALQQTGEPVSVPMARQPDTDEDRGLRRALTIRADPYLDDGPARVAVPLPVRSAMRVQVGLGGETVIGPGAVAIVSGATTVELRWPRAAAAIELHVEFPQLFDHGEGSGSTEMQRVYATLVGCFHPVDWLGTCGVTELGVLLFTRKDRVGSDDAPHFHAALGGRVQLELGGEFIKARAFVQATGVLVRTQITTQAGAGTTFTPPPANVAFGLSTLFVF